MAVNAEEFVVSLVDRVSGPASAAGAMVGGLASKMTALTNAANQASNAIASVKPDAASSKLSNLSSVTEQVSGRLVNMGGPLGAVQSGLARLGPYGIAAAATLAVLTIAVTATVGALTAMAAAAISVVQQRAHLLATFSALGGGDKAGKATLEMVEKLSEKLPFSTEQLGAWAKSLQAAGVPAANLKGAVAALAAAQALMGNSGAEAAQNLIARLAEGGKGATETLKQIQQGSSRSNKMLAEMGLTSADVAKQLGKTPAEMARAKVSAAEMQKAIEKALSSKGSGALDQLGATFPNIIAKAKEGLGSLFEGLGPSIQPFMAAVKSLFGEFGRGGNAIKILKPVVQEVFSTLFSWATRAVTFLHDGFQQLEILGLKLYIALHPFITKIREFASSQNFITGLKGAFIALGVVVAVAALPFVILGVAALVVVAAFVALVAGAIWLSGAITNAVMGAVNRVKAAFSSFKLPNLAAAAKNMIASFVSAITGGIGQVVSAMLSMGSAAKGALFNALGIHSPSRVALEAAANVTTTFSEGVDDGKGKTKAAFAGMVKGVEPGSGGARRSGGGKGDAIRELAAAVRELAGRMGDSPGLVELVNLVMAEAANEGEPA